MVQIRSFGILRLLPFPFASPLLNVMGFEINTSQFQHVCQRYYKAQKGCHGDRNSHVKQSNP